jgi:2-dehydro-3-deoxyglucarate aldolase
VIQIESANAIQNLDMLLDSSYVYAAIIGPYDLSASFNKPGVFDCLEMKQATAKFLSSCRSKKVMPGFHVVSSDSRKAIEKSEEGYEFLALGVDFIFLQEAMKKLITDISL